jgi:hypothetical protein
MEKYPIAKDIKLFYVEADSFPLGVGGAFNRLYQLIGSNTGRIPYGISFPDGKGSLVYRAAIEEAFPGEAEKAGCATFIVRKGEYISEFLTDWKKNESIVGRTFQQLLKDPHIDRNGYCLEIYPNEKDMRCLVPLAQQGINTG